MALLPMLLNTLDEDDLYYDPYDIIEPRSRLRHILRFAPYHAHSLTHRPAGRAITTRPKSNSGLSSPFTKDGFKAIMDVKSFKPEEVSVKVVGRSVVVEGRHEEKEDEHGLISRHFVRRYELPKEYDLDSVQSSLSSEGVLTVEAKPQKKAIEEKERVITIERKGSKETKEQNGDVKMTE